MPEHTGRPFLNHGGILSAVKLFLYMLVLLTAATAPAAGNRATVTKIIDVDTIHVDLNGSVLKVRLIGIDAPEKVTNSKTKRDSNRTGDDIRTITAQGKRAAKYLKSILRKGTVVTLEYDLQQHDRHGRTLAYVYLPDGRMLNELIITSGYAVPLTVPPNVRYRDRFSRAYKEARAAKRGLWAE